MKKIREFVVNFFKDKWNIAISILILLVVVLGIYVVGTIKTFAIATFVTGMVLALKYGSVFFMKKNYKKTTGVKKSISSRKNNASKKARVSKKSKKRWQKFVNLLFIIALCLSILAIVGSIAFMGYIITSAPAFDKEKLYYKEASILYDINGKEITRMGEEMRDKVTYDEIPQVFVDAIIATEDSRYFEHNGFDLPRFLKASAGQALGNSGAGGASTISMQVIKNNFTSTDKKVTRKFTDIYLAVFKLEKEYTKEQILEFYVNDIHLGINNSFGIAETSRGLFGKEIGDINLSEAALLAGMFQAPGAYNPYNYPESAASRRRTVLYLMEHHGYITKEESAIANNIPVGSLIVDKSDNVEPYQSYIDYVAKEVSDKTGFDPLAVPMKIYTNLNPSKQNHVNNILNGTAWKWENDTVQAGIAVTDVNTGAVLALGGGRNRAAKTLNWATYEEHQVGSTAKPLFDYGPGMEFNNWSTYTPFVDDAYSYSNGPEIHNWDNKYNGMLTLRYSLAQSRNIPALKAFQQVDNKKIIKFVESLGITPEIEGGLIHQAHSIGGFNGASPLQLAVAYAAFANGGYYIKPYAVNKVEIIDTSEIMTYKSEKVRVMSDSTAYMITNVLKYGVDNKLIGGGRISGIEVAAKSGTSNYDDATKKRYGLSASAINDLWYAGYTPDTAVAMWYGYEKISAAHYSRSPSTSIIRDKIFTAIANGIFDKNGKKFNIPGSVTQVHVEKGTIPAMLPSRNTPSNMLTTEFFKKGTEPTEVSPRFNTLPNVNALDAVKDGTNVKLSWQGIAAPNMMTSEYLATISAQKDKYLGIRANEDARILGTLGYNIYLKKSTGELTFLGWSATTNYTHKPSASGSLTYVVKSCYSIMKGSESSGATVILSNSPYVPVVEMYMNGEEILSVPQNSIYTDAGATILEDGINIKSKATITTVITKGITNEVVTKIDTSVKSITYKITYTITYNGDSETFVRTINII